MGNPNVVERNENILPHVNRLRKLFMGDGFDPLLKDSNKDDRQEGEKVVF